MLTFTLTQSERSVTFLVRDTGTGIDEATRQRIFEPFFTTKARGRGTGLGLASVREVVRRLGGSVSCESQVGVGTSFKVELPRLVGARPKAERDEKLPAADALRGRRVLVVEDDLRVRAVLVGALEGAGAVVADADTGNRAISLAERGEQFDLVLTDVVMPDGGASSLLGWLSKHRPHWPIIICSGYAGDELVRRDVELGRYRLLNKPVSPEQVVAACAAELEARLSTPRPTG